jgi:hypothetical protein
MHATFTYGDCSFSELEEEEEENAFLPPPRLTVLTQALMNPTISSPNSATCARARVIHQHPENFARCCHACTTEMYSMIKMGCQNNDARLFVCL